MATAQSTTTAAKSLTEELRHVQVLTDLPDDALNWLAERVVVRFLQPGDVLIERGSPADRMYFIIDGEIRATSDHPEVQPVAFRTGQVSGMLPFSRMTEFARRVRAVLPSRVAELSTSHFPEMLNRIPELGQRLVGIMSDRIREVAKLDLQGEKLKALGKLSAGLAHELNNPAAAARRAAESLRETLHSIRRASTRLDAIGVPGARRADIAQHAQDSIEEIANIPVLDSLAQSDREEEISSWLAAHGVDDPWTLAPVLVETGANENCLSALTRDLPVEAAVESLRFFVSLVATERIIRDIENSTMRISELVRSVKEYSYMDTAPEQDIDIHRGIESTLTMLGHKLKRGVNVTREYDSSLPRIEAHGSELNQVWTNLIDNAIDAMDGKGEMRIRTCRELDSVLVEIQDNGSGIPTEIQHRVFEPFFTTKGVGKGTGLGLDSVYRIVRKHHGDVRFDSEPGRTVFQVRVPFHQPGHPRPHEEESE